MINILFVFGCPLKKGGTENVMINICEHINKFDFHIDFLIFDKTIDESKEKKYLESLGCKFYAITARGVDRRKHNEELDSFFKSHKYDIVHTHMDAIGEEALKKAKKYGVKARIAHSHNTNQLENPSGFKEIIHKIYLVIEKHLLRYYATQFLACSYEAGAWLFGNKICHGNNFLVLNNAIDLNRFTFDPLIREKKRSELGLINNRIIIHVGQFRKQKNHDLILDIFKELHDLSNVYKLILVGDGEEKVNIENKAFNLGIIDSVFFLGNRSDISELLQAADLFIFPSLYEGLGISLIEAQAADLPCVISDTIPPQAIITDKVVVLNLSDSVEEWTKEIVIAMSNCSDRVSRINEFVDHKYDIQSQINELENFYRKAINNE